MIRTRVGHFRSSPVPARLRGTRRVFDMATSLFQDPVVYQVLGKEQAALPTAGRRPKSRIRRGLHQVAAVGVEPTTRGL